MPDIILQGVRLYVPPTTTTTTSTTTIPMIEEAILWTNLTSGYTQGANGRLLNNNTTISGDNNGATATKRLGGNGSWFELRLDDDNIYSSNGAGIKINDNADKGFEFFDVWSYDNGMFKYNNVAYTAELPEGAYTRVTVTNGVDALIQTSPDRITWTTVTTITGAFTGMTLKNIRGVFGSASADRRIYEARGYGLIV